MNILIFIIAILITIIIIASSKNYWDKKFKIKGAKIALIKYEEYQKSSNVFFCYNDNYFLSNKDTIVYIKNNIIEYKNDKFNLTQIKEIKYQFYIQPKIDRDIFNRLKIYFYLKNGETKIIILPGNMEVFYQYAFILLIDMLINNYKDNFNNLCNRLFNLKNNE